MKNLFLFLSFSVALLSCSHSKKAAENPTPKETAETNDPSKDSVVMTIKRGQCFGSCPAYSMNIYNSGLVEYDGKSSVDLIGKYTTHITQEQIAAFREKAKSVGYMQMEDEYDNKGITDLPETTTSIILDGVFKQIRRRYGYPRELLSFERMFDQLLMSERWAPVN